MWSLMFYILTFLRRCYSQLLLRQQLNSSYFDSNKNKSTKYEKQERKTDCVSSTWCVFVNIYHLLNEVISFPLGAAGWHGSAAGGEKLEPRDCMEEHLEKKKKKKEQQSL